MAGHDAGCDSSTAAPLQVATPAARIAARPELRLAGTGGAPVLLGRVDFDPAFCTCPAAVWTSAPPSCAFSGRTRRSNFINVSVNKVNLADWPGFPQAAGDGLAIFGSGSYRASNVRLAFQPAAGIEDASSLRYFAGLDASGNPTWSTDETASIDLFSQPVVGELSVAYNKFLRLGHALQQR